MLELDVMPILSYREVARLLRLDGIPITREAVATAAEILKMGPRRPGQGSGHNLSRRDFEKLRQVFAHRRKAVD